MKEKHLDLNGKNIKIGDIVLIHKHSPCRPGCNVCKLLEKELPGQIAEVFDFGCVQIRLESGKIETIYTEEDLEIIGNVRCKKPL
jgi:hypothetical protein